MLRKAHLLRCLLRSLLDVQASTPASRLSSLPRIWDLSQHPFNPLCQQTARAVLFFFLLVVSASAASDYGKVLDHWSRHARVFTTDNLEMKLKWHATYLSVDFREARRDKLSLLLAMSPKEVDRLKKEDLSDNSRYDDFMVALYVGSGGDSSLGTRTSDWNFLLESEGQTVRAVSADYQPISQKQKILYSYLDPWSRLYRVRFPKTIRSGESFLLKMVGIPASSELVWKFK
ncbi:MAG: hypothetical protein HYT77_05275 [Deltaproteobacteria bacterium]|nr:hypothetical protein [Deltaproteobacteria bacterium]